MTTFYIVRHGQTDWNVAGRIQGHQESQLTDKGRQQAQERAQNFEGITFDAAYASDLSRAKETAEILLEGQGHTLRTSPRLREVSQGSLEGYHRDKAREEFSEIYELWDRSDDHERMKIRKVPGAETGEEAAERFLDQIKAIARDHKNQTVLVVTHGGVMRIFLFKAGLVELSRIEHIENLGYVVIESDGEQFRLIESTGIKKLNEQGLDKFPKKG
jgi:broad specificity phosphatase PhoE